MVNLDMGGMSSRFLPTRKVAEFLVSHPCCQSRKKQVVRLPLTPFRVAQDESKNGHGDDPGKAAIFRLADELLGAPKPGFPQGLKPR